MADETYRVVNQEPDTALNDATGRVERGYRVYFVDNVTGSSGEVFVPYTSYNAENAGKLIQHRLTQLREVAALGT